MSFLISLTAMAGVYAALYLMVGRFHPLWNGSRLWFVCCAAPALASIVLALVMAATEPGIPTDYDPMRDPNYGRWTTALALIFGVIIPGLYVAVTTPLHIVARMRFTKS